MSSIAPAALEQYLIDSQPQGTRSNELGQDEFLTLMLAQIKHQDPMQPMENGEFISELAEFSTVSGIEDMAASLSELRDTYGSSQTLESARLVGTDVLVESDTAMLDADNAIEGRFDLENSTGNVSVNILDQQGQLIRKLELGALPAGRHDFSWDGTNERGQRVAEGEYRIAGEAASGEQTTAVPVQIRRTVESVEFETGGSTLIYGTLGETFTLDDIRQITQAQTNGNGTTGDRS